MQELFQKILRLLQSPSQSDFKNLWKPNAFSELYKPGLRQAFHEAYVATTDEWKNFDKLIEKRTGILDVNMFPFDAPKNLTIPNVEPMALDPMQFNPYLPQAITKKRQEQLETQQSLAAYQQQMMAGAAQGQGLLGSWGQLGNMQMGQLGGYSELQKQMEAEQARKQFQASIKGETYPNKVWVVDFDTGRQYYTDKYGHKTYEGEMLAEDGFKWLDRRIAEVAISL